MFAPPPLKYFCSTMVCFLVTELTSAAKSEQFTANEIGKDQFHRGNRRNLAEEGIVRKISFSSGCA